MITKLMHRVIWGEQKKGPTIRRSLVEELPAEILMEILRKLPGKQALLCRSVSKTFLGVIDSRCFMERHLRDHDHDDEPSSLLTYGIHCETVLFKLWMCKTRLEESDEEKVLKVEDRSLWKYPRMRNESYFNPISSNGLILVRCGSSSPYVFNPIRKEAMKTPIQKDENAWNQPLGFGYDPKGNTHKIISVWETKELELVAKVFSLRETDCEWRSLDISSSSSALPLGHVSFASSTVTIHKHVYWTATISEGSQAVCSCILLAHIERESSVNVKNWTKHMVLCFDLEMETFEWFSHPAMIHGSLVQVFRLTNLQGTLVMVDFSSEECVGLWTLRDKARGEWSFDYRFKANVLSDKVRHFCRGHDRNTGRLHVVGAWKEGLLLRIWDSTVCFYLNLKTERMEYIGFEKKIQELVSQDFIVAYTPNYLLRLKTYYDQSRVICAHPHAGARLRGRLHSMLIRGDHLAYELRYYYDSIKSPFDELIGFRYGKLIQHPPKIEITDSAWTYEDM